MFFPLLYESSDMYLMHLNRNNIVTDNNKMFCMVNDDTSRNSFLNHRMRHRPFNLFCCDFQIFKIVEQFNLTTDSMISYDDSTQLTTEFYYVVYDCYTGCNLNCYHRFKIMFLTLEPVITTEYFRRNIKIYEQLY